jgi:cobalamin biosynthesis protein CobT
MMAPIFSLSLFDACVQTDAGVDLSLLSSILFPHAVLAAEVDEPWEPDTLLSELASAIQLEQDDPDEKDDADDDDKDGDDDEKNTKNSTNNGTLSLSLTFQWF